MSDDPKKLTASKLAEFRNSANGCANPRAGWARNILEALDHITSLDAENAALCKALDDSACLECGGMPGEADGSCGICTEHLNLLSGYYIAALAQGGDDEDG